MLNVLSTMQMVRSHFYGDGLCPDGEWRGPAVCSNDEPYNRLMLAWTWLLSQSGPTLIYYGDELDYQATTTLITDK